MEYSNNKISLKDVLPNKFVSNEFNAFSPNIFNLLDKAKLGNFRQFQNNDGSSKHISANIEIDTGIDFNLLNTGIRFKINPTSPGNTFIPITLNYYYKLPSIVNNFKISSFDFSNESIFNLLLKFTGMNDVKFVQSILNHLSIYNINELIDKINIYYQNQLNDELSHVEIGNNISSIEEFLDEIDSNEYFDNNNIGVFEIITKIYFSSLDDESFNRIIDKIFIPLIGTNYIQSLKSLLIPSFNLKATVLPRIEFPETYLKSINGGVSYIDLNNLVISISNNGFSGFNEEISGSLNSPAYIANTKFSIFFKTLKLDLNRNSNIDEASDLNNDFIGCYVTEAVIGFPASWNHDSNSTAQIVGRNLLIGTGGISGTLGMEAKQGVTTAPILKLKLGQDFNISLDAFSITFQQSSIINSFIAGTLTIPGVKQKDEEGNYINDPVKINIEAFIGNNGDFKINAKPAQDLSYFKWDYNDIIDLQNNLKVIIEQDKIINKISPLVDKLLEEINTIDTNQLVYTGEDLEQLINDVNYYITDCLYSNYLDIISIFKLKFSQNIRF